MKDLTEFIKSTVRPYIIYTGWAALLFLWIYEVVSGIDIEIPLHLLVVADAITLEYVGERVVKRIKEAK